MEESEFLVTRQKKEKGTCREFDTTHLQKNIEELKEIKCDKLEIEGSCAPILIVVYALGFPIGVPKASHLFASRDLPQVRDVS